MHDSAQFRTVQVFGLNGFVPLPFPSHPFHSIPFHSLPFALPQPDHSNPIIHIFLYVAYVSSIYLHSYKSGFGIRVAFVSTCRAVPWLHSTLKNISVVIFTLRMRKLSTQFEIYCKDQHKNSKIYHIYVQSKMVKSTKTARNIQVALRFFRFLENHVLGTIMTYPFLACHYSLKYILIYLLVHIFNKTSDIGISN